MSGKVSEISCQGKLCISDFIFGAMPMFSSVHVLNAVKYDVGNHNLVRVLPRVWEVSENFTLPCL